MLVCSADGTPPLFYEWYYNDTKIQDGNVLTVSNAVYGLNDGFHICKVINSFGFQSTAAHVDVRCKSLT